MITTILMFFMIMFFIIMVLISLSTICIYYGLSMCTSHPILGFLLMTLPFALILAILGTAIATGG